MDKLTTQEVKQRIDQYVQRSQALEEIIDEIKDLKAKTALKKHIASYKETILQLQQELSKRNLGEA